MARAFLFVLDSVGIGGAPDAADFGDHGACTVGHIAQACARGEGDQVGLRSGPLAIPNLLGLGLGHALSNANGANPFDLRLPDRPTGAYAHAREVSTGKDTITGHWEISGVPVQQPWGYFPNTDPAFPQSLTDAIIKKGEVPGLLGLKHLAGTQAIEWYGVEHITSGKPIAYTSADSVLQIAAHEEFFGLERLYRLCAVARELVDPLHIGRVIARPFVGKTADTFERTGNRRDYAIPPPEPTLLDVAEDNERGVFAVGKISDIFTHRGVTDTRKANGNDAMVDITLQVMDDAADGDFVFVNFIDFDQLYGHRRDVPGYAACLEHFDNRLPELMAKLRDGDMMVLTADHGNDPTWAGTDHTREQVPVLITGPGLPVGDRGGRQSFADIAATLASHLGLPPGRHGTKIL